jgi:ATP-dependent DNA helicase 2 subunit 2
MISAYCKKLKYKRKIVLITNGTGLMNSEGIDEIQKKLKEDNIQITVM